MIPSVGEDHKRDHAVCGEPGEDEDTVHHCSSKEYTQVFHFANLDVEGVLSGTKLRLLQVLPVSDGAPPSASKCGDLRTLGGHCCTAH